jgi:hypothetical protein
MMQQHYYRPSLIGKEQSRWNSEICFHYVQPPYHPAVRLPTHDSVYCVK